MIEDIPTLTSDSGWLVIWNDIKNFGSGFWVFLFLINFYLLKEQIKDFFKFLLNTITFKKNVITYTKKDLLKHPIFKDLDYWLKIGIDALHLKENIHDFHSKRGLLMKVGKRRNLLNYLKKTDINRYRELIKSLGLRK